MIALGALPPIHEETQRGSVHDQEYRVVVSRGGRVMHWACSNRINLRSTSAAEAQGLREYGFRRQHVDECIHQPLAGYCADEGLQRPGNSRNSISARRRSDAAPTD